MKKLTGLMGIVMALCVLLAACSGGTSSSAAAGGSSTPTASQSGASSEASGEPSGEPFQVAFCAIYPLDSTVWLTEVVGQLEAYDAAHDDVEIRVVEVTETADYEPKIRALAEAGYDLIITEFSGHVDATLAVAKDFPEIMFFSQDGMIENIGQYDNVAEGKAGDRLAYGFMAGALAGLLTETQKVCFIGGSDIESIQNIAAGWQQGVRYTNPDIEIDTFALANTFSDSSITREMALSYFQKGYDVIGASASGASAGVAQAFAENAEDQIFIAIDNSYVDVAGGREVAASVVRIGNMLVQVIDKAKAGTLELGQSVMYGFGEGVNEFNWGNEALATPEIIAEMDQIMQDIIDGKIEISNEYYYGDGN